MKIKGQQYFNKNYSYLSASIGFRAAAFIAG
jgi:hypothetical protein